MKKADDEKDSETRWSRSKSDDNTKEEKEEKRRATHHAKGAVAIFKKPQIIKSNYR